MTKHISHTAHLLSILFFTILFSISANATGLGKINLNQQGLDAQQIIAKMNIYRTGGKVTLKGCAENCPENLFANKTTQFLVNGKTIKRQDIKKYSGQSGNLQYLKNNGSVLLIDWK